MTRPLVLAIASALALAACAHTAKNESTMTPTATAQPAPAPAPVAVNPFFVASTLQFQAPPFDKIKDEHYLPAFEKGMAEQKEEIAAIANNPAPANFTNTIEAMERSGVLLTRVSKVFFNLTESTTNDAIQKVQADIAPKLAAHQDAIVLDPKLFARVKSLYDHRDSLGLDPESRRVLERYYANFVRNGALLSEADKTRLRALNEEQSNLVTKFQERALKDVNDSALVIDHVEDLKGLTEGDIASAAEAAKARKLDGKWVLPLQNTTGQPMMAKLANRAVRERLYRASIARGTRGNDYDEKAIIARLANLRAERAKLLGFPDHATYTLDDQMAKTPAAVSKLLDQMTRAAVTAANAQAKEMQALIDAEKGGFKLAGWDWEYYAEKLRAKKYALDEEQIRPYLELDRVLKDGVFYAAHELYGLTITERHDLPVYHPDVRVFDVKDADGSSLGIFYADYYARESKRGGAWMDSFVDQSGLFGTHPVIVNVLNIPKPAAGQPTLLTFDETTTLFHEFGHALHGLLSNVKYPSIAGTNTPRDFVEYPSQFNENWATEPKVFANYARHYQTGAAMPAELLEKVKKASKFNQGYTTGEYLAAALLDMDWHSIKPGQPEQDVIKFEAASLKKHGIDMPAIPPRYRTGYFNHIWPGGYSAGYYAYIWTAVLASDSYEWFKEHGGMTRENGQFFRDHILSRGYTQDCMPMYVAFRGHEPSVNALLEKRGLKADGKK